MLVFFFDKCNLIHHKRSIFFHLSSLYKTKTAKSLLNSVSPNIRCSFAQTNRFLISLLCYTLLTLDCLFVNLYISTCQAKCSIKTFETVLISAIASELQPIESVFSNQNEISWASPTKIARICHVTRN